MSTFRRTSDNVVLGGESQDNLVSNGAVPAFGNGDTDPLFGVSANYRGGTGSQGRPSFDVETAAAYLGRANLTWGAIGQPSTLTFAFRQAVSTLPEGVSGFNSFTNIQIQATLLALQSWSDVAQITFVRVDNGSGYSDEAAMLFGNYASGAEGAAAFASLPGLRDPGSSAGDVWINSGLSDNANPVIGGYGHLTLVHEIGHALGLLHPGNYDAAPGVNLAYHENADYEEDSNQYTVMSYFRETSTGGSFGADRFVSAPMLDDIAAMQRLYGANMTTRTGDTVYGFNSNADRQWFTATAAGPVPVFAVWDAGGFDTLDFSGYGQTQMIDLRQGAFSDVGGLRGNVSIALGTVIENVIGGSGWDTIYGNTADNRITPGAGFNIVDGGLGSDTLVLSGALSSYIIQWRGNSAQIDDIQSGTLSRTIITNVEFLAFSDQTIVARLSGAVIVEGDRTDDLLIGSAFNDTLTGFAGNDVLDGAGGNDTLNPGQGYDTVNAGAGDDIIFTGLGEDTVSGGEGRDTLNFSNATGPVIVNLSNGMGQGSSGMTRFTGIENLVGSNFSDTLIGDAEANVINGGAGSDTVYGGAGNDVLGGGASQGGGADDVIKAQSIVNDSTVTAVLLDQTFDALFTESVNNPTIPHATVIATTHGGYEYYAFTVTQPNTYTTLDIDAGTFDTTIALLDQSGNQIAFNDDGTYRLDGGEATDSYIQMSSLNPGTYYVRVGQWLSGSGASATSTGPAAGQQYTLHVSVGNHTVQPSFLVGSRIYGEGGSDSLRGSGGNDILDGGSGDDVLFGFSGDDELIGGDGWDIADYSASTTFGVNVNLVTGRATGNFGNDRLTGIEGVRGTESSDILTGDSQANLIEAGGGNDVMTGGAGNDMLSGGGGTDAAIYAGVRRQYAATNARVSGGPEGGTDTISNIEELRFVDGTLSFNVDGIEAQVMRLYDATLDRQPDQAGLDVQIRALASGAATLQSLADGFVASAEFQSRYGTLSNQQFVEQLYRFCLNREGDAFGIALQVNALNTGSSRSALVVGFSESLEHRILTQPVLNGGLWVANDKALQVARLYDATLDRLPDAVGLAGQLAALNGGTSLLQLAANFVGSPEFQARYGALSNQQFVEQLYRFCLDREGDAAGIGVQVNALNTGTSRAQLVLAFSESPEHVALTAPLYSGGIRTSDAAFDAAPVQNGAGKPIDLQPLVLVQADDALPVFNADEARVLPGSVTNDPAEIVVGFKLVDDAFVVPAEVGLVPGVRPEADPLDVALVEQVALPSLTGNRMLTLDDNTLDEAAPWHRGTDTDGWMMQ